MRIQIILFPVFIFFLSACIKEDTEPSFSKIETGSKLPYFTLTDSVGNQLSSDKFRGNIVLIIFFSTTCKDCQRDLPVIESVWKNLRTEDRFLLLPIARKQTAEEVKSYWEVQCFSMPYYLDSSGEIYSLFATKTIPRFYLANQEGIVTWQEAEVLTRNAEEIAAWVKDHLSFYNFSISSLESPEL